MKLSLILALTALLGVACSKKAEDEASTAKSIPLPTISVNCAGSTGSGPCSTAEGNKYISLVIVNPDNEVVYFGSEGLASGNCSNAGGCTNSPTVSIVYNVATDSPAPTTTMTEGKFGVFALLGGSTSQSVAITESFLTHLRDTSSVLCMSADADADGLLTIGEGTTSIDLSACMANPF